MNETIQTAMFTIAWSGLLVALPLWMMHDLRSRRSRDQLDLEPLKAYVAQRARRNRKSG